MVSGSECRRLAIFNCRFTINYNLTVFSNVATIVQLIIVNLLQIAHCSLLIPEFPTTHPSLLTNHYSMSYNNAFGLYY